MKEEMTMKLKINKWGASAGLRLPKTLLELLNVQIGDELDVVVNGKTMTLTKARKDGFRD